MQTTQPMGEIVSAPSYGRVVVMEKKERGKVIKNLGDICIAVMEPLRSSTTSGTKSIRVAANY